MFRSGLLRPRSRWLLAGLLLVEGACGAQTVSQSPGGGQGGGPAGWVPGFQLPDAASPPAGSPPPPNRQCVEESHQAETVPLDLMLLVDSSGSMNGAVGQSSKWVMAGSALRAFIRDPRSAGLGMGLQFFPASSLDRACLTDADCGGGMFKCMNKSVCAGPGAATPGVVCRFLPPVSAPGVPPVPVPPAPGTASCPSTSCVVAGLCSATADECTNIGQPCPAGGGTCDEIPRVCRSAVPFDECEPGNYQKAAVTIAPLPMAELPLARALAARIPAGNTPMAAAVAGALGQLRAQLAANPGRKGGLVLASDGVPSDCPGAPATTAPIDIARDLSAAFMGTPSIRTYVIGVFSAGEVRASGAVMDRFAMAGGTDRAFVLTATSDLTRQLQEALDQIRGAALACEYKIPTPSTGRIDFGQVNVRHSGPAGSETIPYVERADRCDPARGGWYYDTPPSQAIPTRILMCDATCGRFTADPTGKVDLVFGCATVIQ